MKQIFPFPHLWEGHSRGSLLRQVILSIVEAMESDEPGAPPAPATRRTHPSDSRSLILPIASCEHDALPIF